MTSNDGTSWHLLCYKRCQLVPSSDTCLVGYELTSDDGTSWHLLVVRVDMGMSWHLLCGNRCQLVPSFDTCLAGYELTSLVVRVDITCGTSWHFVVVRADMGTSWHGYELTDIPATPLDGLALKWIINVAHIIFISNLYIVKYLCTTCPSLKWMFFFNLGHLCAQAKLGQKSLLMMVRWQFFQTHELATSWSQRLPTMLSL